MPKSFTYSIKTMGCKANIYDSLLIERELGELGGTRDDATPDVFVLNSCTVTAEADKQCNREVKLIKKRSPGTWALVTGCFAQVAPERLDVNPNVDRVVSNENKSALKRVVAEKFGLSLDASLPDPEIFWGQLPTEKGKTRAFIKIQEGCNDFCTYCIIPYARGKSRSVRMGQILAEIKRLIGEGIQEVILTGTNIGDYGKEFGSCIEDLIDAILAHTDLKRLRLTSLDPSEISDRILEHMKPSLTAQGSVNASRVMPHIHVSLQSPVSRVLRAMKRDYRREQVVDALLRIHAANPDIHVGMDVIAGFPSETALEHQEAVATLRELPWTRLHVFPYSEREGTPALKIPDSVPVQERRARAQELMSLSHARHESFVKRFVGTTISDVLFENVHEAGGDYFIIGHSPNYLRVMARVPTRSQSEAEKVHNTLGSARTVGLSPKPAQDWTLEGVLAGERT